MSLVKEPKTHMISPDDLKQFIKEAVEKDTGRKVDAVYFRCESKIVDWGAYGKQRETRLNYVEVVFE